MSCDDAKTTVPPVFCDAAKTPGPPEELAPLDGPAARGGGMAPAGEGASLAPSVRARMVSDATCVTQEKRVQTPKLKRPASSLHHRRATHVSDLPNSPSSAGPCVLCAPHTHCTTMVFVALSTQLTFWTFMVRWTHRIVMSEGRYYFRGPLLGSSENVPVLQFVREFESPRPIFESGLAAMLVRRSVLPESKPRSMHFLPFRGDGEMNVHPARKDERPNT